MLLIPVAAPAQEIRDLHATYEMYAAGFHVAEIDASLHLTPSRYELRISYHTTGVMGVFRHGHQVSTVMGTWKAGQPQPQEYQSDGAWNGEDHVTLIDYLNGQPLVRRLEPPQAKEREPVPEALQRNSLDSLSALALLLRRVQDTGHCDAVLHTFDGNRASEISARTAGQESLQAAADARAPGDTLRCDFVSHMLAGFLYRDSTPYDRRPLHGSAWLATVIPGAPPVPVRMKFETQWFGEATVELTHLEPRATTEVAVH